MGQSILFTILLFLSVSAFAQEPSNQTDAQGHKQGFWQKRDATGKLLYEGIFKDNRPMGEMKRFHPNGKIKASLIYSAGSDTSSATLYDEEGQKIAQGKYAGQMKTGEWNYFTEGKLVSSETFQYNLKNGLAKKYYQSGELLEESNWKNNLKDGLYKAFYKNGKSYLECMYKLGMLDGWCISFYPNGGMETETFYKNKLREGDSKYYDEEGKLCYMLKYNKGILMNPEVLDSIQNKRVSEFEKNKCKVVDPEKFMADPEQYMMKTRDK